MTRGKWKSYKIIAANAGIKLCSCVKRNKPEMPRIYRNKAILFKINLMCGLIFLLLGCSQIIRPATKQPAEAQQVPSLPTEGDATQMTQPVPTVSDSRLQGLIETAKEDLAQRLSIPATQINLVEVMEVEWSDASLDCPQPGVDYIQVLTPGYRILLEAGGQEYEYHSNRDTYVVYCQDPIPPILPKP
jgi:hypothetical protein